MDSLSTQDMMYRQQMERGSARLAEAIKWARKGYNPATPDEPMKLPPDWTNKIAPDYAKKAKHPRSAPSAARVREMMERGMQANEIASVLKQSRERVEGIMRKIKLERRREDFGQRYQQDRWG